MTRIISGAAGSIRLTVPPRGTRPTSDKVREAIFSTLDSWGFVTDTRVLDLYAGSGALGLEALSRGAAHADLVEKHPGAVKIITANTAAVQKALQAAEVSATATAHQRDVQSYLEGYGGSAYDVVFIDPPYDFTEDVITANLTALLPHLTADACVLVERDSRSPEPRVPAGLRPVKHAKYGETTCWWYEPAGD
ncbi:16S rRNA (guanine(966)-N(2))-methyltransferase RsmD [Leucobacter sp. OH1287]|uniref:16S rRNA (guanine(966)-N(2))-methyltransferase RsmD n=1 Tax=Leucobacter sp. OH1287 TaxID=2491049 RepID=UPI000F5EEA4E|nr:16S rRNA (guanine(966)-N(2))-methyltransferase RsmD [Leucobacter sp. OH1287]RRD60488.1 16S rRNA (guanine(966)-N(2))-methyltransferase RsmD [Leucobacter sp. OH1287]